tara:strand:- start:21090 stop:22136 length:1047 start_codon:yes stop_codon:yes gene_type:complete
MPKPTTKKKAAKKSTRRKPATRRATKGKAWAADNVQRRAIAELIPAARNARTHTPEQISKIAASIKEWGWTQPILVDEEGMIIAGHGRVLAAQELKLVEVPTMVATGWTAAQKRAYLIADNQLGLASSWDDDLLGLELDDLEDIGFDINLTGFDFVGDIPDADVLPPDPPKKGGRKKPSTAVTTGVSGLEFGALTALERTSGPMRFWKKNDLLREPHLDLGSGKEATATHRYDPFHAPDVELLRRRWSSITCNYVLNVQPSDHLITQIIALAYGMLDTRRGAESHALFAVWNSEPHGLRRSGKGWQNTKTLDDWQEMLGQFFEVAPAQTSGTFYAFVCSPLPRLDHKA